jgi:hypothetical protein
MVSKRDSPLGSRPTAGPPGQSVLRSDDHRCGCRDLQALQILPEIDAITIRVVEPYNMGRPHGWNRVP